MSHKQKMDAIDVDEWYIELVDGSKWYPGKDNPRISHGVLAHALGNLCRYTGHSEYFYSVAEHLVKVSHMVPEEYAFEALMHDAHEVLVNDLSKPVKVFIGGSYADLEEKAEVEVRTSYGLDPHISPVVKQADIELACIEGNEFMYSRGLNWTYYNEFRDRALRKAEAAPFLVPAGWGPNIMGYCTGRASKEWLARFQELYQPAE